MPRPTHLPHKRAITTDKLEDEGMRDFRKGVICRPCYVGGRWVGLGILAGTKQDYIFYVADELQFMQEAFSGSWPHLFSNGQTKIIGSGNPKHDPDDELSKTAEPKDGGSTGSIAFSGPGTTPTQWMVIGQILVSGQGLTNAGLAFPGPFTFEVTAITDGTHATLTRRATVNDGLVLQLSAGATFSPAGYPGVNDVTVATTTNLTGILTGNGANVGFLANPLPVANGGTGSSAISDAAKALTFRYRLLAKVTAANFNSTADQSITGLPAKWIIRRIVVQNASVNMTTAAGGFYTGAGKSGTVIVAAAQTYAALTAATIWMDLTLAAGVLTGTDALTATTIYFALTTAQGVAATGDIYIWGEDIS